MIRQVVPWIAGSLAVLFTMLAAHAAPATAKPTLFAPGMISGPANDAAATFTPDGKTVFFTRGDGLDDDILVSHRKAGGWSVPAIAPFSGTWRDLEPALAPGGTYLIFASSRPDPVTHRRPDGYWGGTTHPGRGGNLWRVDRTPHGWSAPRRLPDSINRNGSEFGPAIAANGDLYFSDVYGKSKRTHLFFARFKGGAYENPAPMPFTDSRWSDADAAVAPDETFMIFASTRPPTPPQQMDLFIVFRRNGRWSTPRHLPTTVNHMATNTESRLGPDGHTLYFTSDYIVPVAYPKTIEAANRGLQRMQVWNDGKGNIWKIDLSPWLERDWHGGTG